ncbi:CamS family sex pheromone protein [Cytobacillus kochii]|uniref:CamS family sex pheromone protein n=1 Tax=Cytobacillus kochii TaxID=859143 RepID=UPI0025A0E25A|nr:CamS family sex pheromone protein [Cytobacillus kochii]MDM5206008.1 CamS family sex pheromone protein [Cytobacillus kochii]
MKKLMAVSLSFVLLLAGCAPSFNQQEEVVQNENESSEEEQAIIPNFKISDSYYRTILPFKPSESRGLVVNNVNTKYDINEFETGLMRVAQNHFDTEKFFFQEGQYLDQTTISSWLSRQYTKEQLEEKDMTEEENLGLNPVDDGKGTKEERNARAPLYLAHILEHNYLVKDGDNKVKLGGVVIGLALNSVHYYQKEAYGATYEEDISHSKVEAEGKKMAEEIIKRLRQQEGLENVPITIALFEQSERTSVVPGNFFAYAHAAEGSNQLSGWEDVKEDYILFPSNTAEEKYREDYTNFLNFKQDVEKYFPNFNGVIGKGFYIGDQLQQLNIDIPIQFYGKSESVGFTQYVTSKVVSMFPEYISVQVSVTSVNGPESLIVRNANEAEPFVHIYQ